MGNCIESKKERFVIERIFAKKNYYYLLVNKREVFVVKRSWCETIPAIRFKS